MWSQFGKGCDPTSGRTPRGVETTRFPFAFDTVHVVSAGWRQTLRGWATTVLHGNPLIQLRDVAPGMHPAVERIEEILAAAGEPWTPDPDGARVSVGRALSLCACVAWEDAPTWLIAETSDGTIGWCRVPARVAAIDLVDAERFGAGHAEPSAVLAWLEGTSPDPWTVLGDGPDDPDVVDTLTRLIRHEPPPEQEA